MLLINISVQNDLHVLITYKVFLNILKAESCVF